jgi:UDP-GlcNAc:undecaprenyl-phosphate/decaprenyl-phosphate GlcNAc-1-phosphate transferase
LILEWLAQTDGKFLGGFRASLAAGGIALVMAWLLTPFVRSFAIRRGAIDDPTRDARRVHTEPIPRWGGLAIYAGILVSLAVILPFAYPHQPFPRYLLGVLGVGALIVVMGALDDLYQFKARVQMLFLIAAGVAIQFVYGPAGRVQIAGIEWPLFADTGVWVPFAAGTAIVLTALYIFVITKTMDTIDGLDGLAAGIAAIAGATLSIIATYSEQPRVAIIAAALAGASIGFLRHNYNPAKIFMGTGGAQLLGFMLACLSIVGALKTAAAIALIIPLLVFGVPIFDAAFVVVRRVLSRQPITQADKRHLHHTLLGTGLTQKQTVWIMYTIAAALCFLLLVVIKLYG